MNERMISGEKYEALKQQLADTDQARIQAEQDRDTAYSRIGEQGARIAELETTVAAQRAHLADVAGTVVTLCENGSTEHARLALDENSPLVDRCRELLVLYGTGKDAPQGAIDAASPDTSDANPTVTEGGQEGEGGSDLGVPRG